MFSNGPLDAGLIPRLVTVTHRNVEDDSVRQTGNLRTGVVEIGAVGIRAIHQVTVWSLMGDGREFCAAL